MKGLYWGNRLGVPNNLGFLERRLQLFTFLKDQTTTYFVWVGPCPVEFNLTITEDEKEFLNQHGVAFYIFEPLIFLTKGINNHILDSTVDISDIFSEDLDIIDSIVTEHGLTNVTVFTTDYLSSALNQNYPNFRISCLDIFLKWYYSGNQYIPDVRLTDKSIIKKFHCSNWRYAVHRLITTSYLVNYDGYYSWYYKCNFDQLFDEPWFEKDQVPLPILNRLEQGLQLLNKNRYLIDYNLSAKNTHYLLPKKKNVLTDKFRDSIKQSFCVIVNESRFAQPFANFSEKTVAAIETLTPFVLVAPPRTLEYIKKLGFKTFDQWWDESYDLETNHTKRLLKIFEVIDYINSKSINELELIYQEMSLVLLENRKVIENFSYELRPLP